MLRLQCLVFYFIIYFTFGDTSAVSFIKPCKPDDHACNKASIIHAMPYLVAGVPELDIPSSDPMTIDNISTEYTDFKMSFKNLKVTGLSKCKVLDVVRDLEKSTIKLMVKCPLKGEGQYSLKGKILFVPAEGDGDFTITADEVNIEVTIKIKTIEANNEKHWKITGFDYTYDIISKAVINFNNLFNGDEAKAIPILKIIDQSGNQLITEFGAPIFKELVNNEMKILQKFFDAAPVSKLELS